MIWYYIPCLPPSLLIILVAEQQKNVKSPHQVIHPWLVYFGITGKDMD